MIKGGWNWGTEVIALQLKGALPKNHEGKIERMTLTYETARGKPLYDTGSSAWRSVRTQSGGIGGWEGRVVSDLTLKSVPCPSSPGVVPHCQAGGVGEQSLPGSGVKEGSGS